MKIMQGKLTQLYPWSESWYVVYKDEQDVSQAVKVLQEQLLDPVILSQLNDGSAVTFELIERLTWDQSQQKSVYIPHRTKILSFTGYFEDSPSITTGVGIESENKYNPNQEAQQGKEAIQFAYWIASSYWKPVYVDNDWMWEYKQPVHEYHPYQGFHSSEDLYGFFLINTNEV